MCAVLSHSVVSNLLEPHGLSVHGIFQARILEWVAISYSRGSSWPRDQTSISLFFFFLLSATPLGCRRRHGPGSGPLPAARHRQNLHLLCLLYWQANSSPLCHLAHMWCYKWIFNTLGMLSWKRNPELNFQDGYFKIESKRAGFQLYQYCGRLSDEDI